jgi:glycosyltransferase involved in cell wall biosynthesis
MVGGVVSVLLCVSLSETQAAKLLKDGPRRDFVELARLTEGTLLYAAGSRGRGILGRFVGPHVRQAFRAARSLHAGDTCFADGEHIGIPLLFALALQLKRRVRVVMLGHLVDRPWKKFLLRVATRLVPNGSLLLHSTVQREKVHAALAKSWKIELVPYQVDTSYWVGSEAEDDADGFLLAVGSENRDYETLAAAVDGEPVRVRIAAGSHWARRVATSSSTPTNVEYIDTTLPFSELRRAYEGAWAVVVPLEDVTNQSGVTVILEAMSMRRPVIVTATRGQRECVTGPLVTASGGVDYAATSERGPQLFGDPKDPGPTGLYVSVADPAGLKAAVQLLHSDTSMRRRLGEAARDSAEAHFSIERYARALADAVLDGAAKAAPESVAAAQT